VIREIKDTVFIAARCTMNIGGGSYRYTLSCGHVEYRWASRRIRGRTMRCTSCKGKT
jgi:predicted SprT family Zn-dependent metalloprotease